ncbi:ATP-dependent RNA helicase RhlE [Arcticibacter svalbardensis MN12-7]|uniref:ATP-dependent RNA helicase RhlE n=1 Tax=Arcticibacter svalbardensis MN12-7 TaxID=1150600 RepID=R9GNP3_9SPHI|nr:DEAD/DEAH box helicase [Arcticibacter svalbardensis]EOR93343.1 ATP-dependent RNA helicase RhlE [Arcticibacter svalbardensis MN12-7]
MPFTSLGLSPALLKALADQNYTLPTPIQQAVIPAILNKKDILGIAKTGSGKTAGYVLPVLMNLQHTIETKNRHVNVLVLVPTRELAVQVKDVFQVFSPFLTHPIKTLAVFGGVSINPQMMALQGVHILVATPGRLLELLDSKAVHLTDIDTLVLDEADKMLNLGFKEEMTRIIDLLPKKRQNLLFSATLTDDIKQINQIVLNDPLVIKIDAEQDTIDTITQVGYLVPDEKKGPLLRYLIKKHDMKQVLVFAASTYQTDNIADKLRKNGIDAKAIHSKKSQGARTEALRDFKSGELRVLVATDLMARGIDINFLPYVINYELPRSPKDYIHRIGRTGRAEAPGDAISLVSPQELHHFGIIQKKMGKLINTIDSESLGF